MSPKQLEKLLWVVEDDLRPCQEPVRAWAGQHGIRIEEELAKWWDESLALAIKKDCLRKPAYEELMKRRYEGRMHAWFMRWRRDDALAWDLTQQMHVKLYAGRLATYDPARAAFAGYLWSCCRKHFISKVLRAPGCCPGGLLEDPPIRLGRVDKPNIRG
jgi:hypothetical protein